MAESQAPGSVAQGARCALHYGQPFTTICRRCGTYMCRLCSEDGKFEFCPACRARTGVGPFPLRRVDLRWAELLRFAFAAYRRRWLVLAAAALVAFVGMMLVQSAAFLLQMLLIDRVRLLLALQSLLVVPQVLLQGLLTLGWLDISLRAARGEPVEVGMLFGAWRRLGAFLLQMLAGLVVALPLLLLCCAPLFVAFVLMQGTSSLAVTAALACVPIGVAGIYYVGLGLVFGSFELLTQPDLGALDALRNSWAIVRGQRLTLLLGAFVGFASVFAGFMLCGVGALFAYGFAGVLFACLYLGLRNGAEGLLS
jgi:hypothetical protein